MRVSALLSITVAVVSLAGCHSAYINATVSNHTAETLELVEVDYPSASFGTQALAPGADFHYRFKVLGSGATTVLWTDAAHRDHKASGPPLQEKDEGPMSVVIGPNGAVWTLHLNNRPTPH